MTTQLRLTPASEIDLAAIFTWYEGQRGGVGRSFIDAAGERFNRIVVSPRLRPEVVLGNRRGLVHRFPYGAYFSLEPNRVVIHAVLHFIGILRSG